MSNYTLKALLEASIWSTVACLLAGGVWNIWKSWRDMRDMEDDDD